MAHFFTLTVAIWVATAHSQQVTGTNAVGELPNRVFYMFNLLEKSVMLDGREASDFYRASSTEDGEAALAAGHIGLTFLDREMNPARIEEARKNGIEPVGRPFAVRAVAVYVNKEETWLSFFYPKSYWARGLHFVELKRIFSCKSLDWNEYNRLGKDGPIHPIVGANLDPQLKAIFLARIGLEKFGPCVSTVPDVEAGLSKDWNAITIDEAGLAFGRAISTRKGSGPLVAPELANIRNRTYPLINTYYAYIATGGKQASEFERGVFNAIVDQQSEGFRIYAERFIEEAELIPVSAQ